MSTTRKRVYGYLAEFKSASALYKAAEKVRDAGFRKWDCYSPYPIHGLDGAMGIKRSILPWFVFFGGMTGTATAFTLAYTHAGGDLSDRGAGEAGEHLHHSGVFPDHVRADDPVLPDSRCCSACWR